MVRVGADISDLRRSMSQVQTEVNRVSTVFGNMGRNITTTIGTIAGITVGVEALKKGAMAGMMFNSQIEQASISFETLTGSAENAKKTVDDLYKMAANTPFDFAGILDNAKKVLAYGFGQSGIKPILTSAGDASAALGKGSAGIESIVRALGQMKAKSKVSAEEMNQLMEVGINGWDYVSKAMGKTVAETQKLSEKGLIPAKTAILAIVEGMEAQFPNMMGKQAKSMQGMASTLKDNVSQLLGQMTKPMFDSIKSELPNIISMVEKFGKGFSQGGIKGGIFAAFQPETANKISKMIDGITTSFAALYNMAVPVAIAIGDVANYVATNWDKIAPIVFSAATAFTGYKIAIGAVTIAQGLLNAATLMFAGPAGIAALIVAIPFATSALISYSNAQEKAKIATLNSVEAVLKQSYALDKLSQSQLDGAAGTATEKLRDVISAKREIDKQIEELNKPGATAKPKIYMPGAELTQQSNAMAYDAKARLKELEKSYQGLNAEESKLRQVIQAAADKPQFDIDKAKELDSIKVNMDDFRTNMDAWKTDFGGTMDSTAAVVEKSFTQLFNIFDKMAEKTRVSPERLLVRMKAQVKNLVDWRSNLQSLKQKGASGQMIEELRGLGLGSSGEVGALTRMSGSDFNQYQDLYNTRGVMSGNPKNSGQMVMNFYGPISSEDTAEKYANQIKESLALGGG